MDNIGKEILDSQIEDFHLDLLLSQKYVYSKAKVLQGILIFITIPLPMALAIFMQTYPKIISEKNWLFVLYLVTAALCEKVIESYIDRIKKIAASIQEMFDTQVLRIEGNETLNTINVDRETIREYSKQSRKKAKRVEKVTNWYSVNIQDLKTNIATILCQRTNVYYDFSVRRRYNWLMRIFVMITSLVLLAVSLKNGIDLKSFLIEVVVPSIPVCMFAYKEINTNTESIDNLKHLKNLIENNLSSIHVDDSIDKSLLRKIQDRIYLNRILSPLIPDSIYNSIRPKLEDEMNYSVNEKIKQLINP